MKLEEFKNMTVEEYRLATVGKDYELPEAVSKFFLFAQQYTDSSFSGGVEIDIQDNYFIYISEDECTQEQIEEYRKRVIKFITVDASGGFCAFWMADGITDVANAPIVNFGSEGDIAIIAQNIYEFLRILTFDESIMDGVCYKVKADYFKSKYIDEYRNWLKNELGLEPVKELDPDQKSGESEDIARFREEAEAKYKEKFIAWQNQYSEFDVTECFNS